MKKKSNPGRVLLTMLALLFISGASAEVTDTSFYGFTCKTSVIVKASNDSLFRYLTRDVSKWWDPAHTYSGNATNLVLQSKANGCFCEKLENGGSVHHMTVVYVEPGRTLRMIGGLGPLQAMAVNGSLTFQLDPEGTETRLTMTYTVGGYNPGGFGKLAPIVDMVLGVQVNRLKTFAEEKP